jgi:hypothetical protein
MQIAEIDIQLNAYYVKSVLYVAVRHTIFYAIIVETCYTVKRGSHNAEMLQYFDRHNSEYY